MPLGLQPRFKSRSKNRRPAFNALIQYDLERGSSRRHDFGPGRVPGEAVFVPASADAAEDGEEETMAGELVEERANGIADVIGS